MSVISPRRIRSEKVIDNFYLARNSSENHPNMDSDLNTAVNADSDSKSSDIHQNGVYPISQLEVNSQIAKVKAEMNEIKGLLSTLTQQFQFIARSEESNALRGSSARNPERINSDTQGRKLRSVEESQKRCQLF